MGAGSPLRSGSGPGRSAALRRFGTTPTLFLLLLVSADPASGLQTAEQGKVVYDRWCAACHGVDGRGDGPGAAYMLPRPRDFTSGLYQIKSTSTGALPTDADILRIIEEGMPGTAMPGWREKLTSQQRQSLVAYLKTFSPFFESEPVPEPLALGRAPRATEETVVAGRAVYEALECWRCHGDEGRGDGPSAFEQTDDDGFPVRPANLNQSWLFTGGDSPEDIYLRLMSGLEGTPMPSQADALASGIVSEEDLWNLVHYVRSLSAESPRIQEVARAALVEGPLPTGVDDEAWQAGEEYYFPLAGQIIARPRWFAPTVTGVWVRALHNGEELALRIRWHDPSQSPDPTWTQWQSGVLAAMQPNEGGPTEAQVLADAFAVQFPSEIPEGMDRPYFLMGSARDPVYLWQWESQTPGATESMASGLGQIQLLPEGQQSLVAESTWEDGQWVLLLKRSLAAPEESGALAVETGRAIPIAFYAWDGDNSEADSRGAISTWYYLYLDEPGSNSVFIFPIAATLLSFALGLAFVTRAKRRASSGENPIRNP